MRFFTLIAALILVGCSSASQTATATTQSVVVTTTAAPTTTSDAPATTIDPNIAEIEAVVTGFLRYTTENAPSVTADGLSDFATQSLVDEATATFTSWEEAGQTVQPGLAAVGTITIDLDASGATVQTCFLDDSALLSADGDVVVEADITPYAWELVVIETAQGWLVSKAGYQGGSASECDL